MEEVAKQELIAKFFKEIEGIPRDNEAVWSLVFVQKLNTFVEDIHMRGKIEGFEDGFREGKKFAEKQYSQLN